MSHEAEGEKRWKAVVQPGVARDDDTNTGAKLLYTTVSMFLCARD